MDFTSTAAVAVHGASAKIFSAIYLNTAQYFSVLLIVARWQYFSGPLSVRPDKSRWRSRDN